MDLTPMPPTEVTCQDGEAKAETMRKLHQKVRDTLQKTTDQYKRQADKKRKEVIFKPGDLVWVHMRPERFRQHRKSKLDPRGDGPFRVLERINDNAYRLDLPGESKIPATFNVADLSLFDDAGSEDKEAPQEGGNDEDIEPHSEPEQDQDETSLVAAVPRMYEAPKTRSAYKAMRNAFNNSVAALLNRIERAGDSGGRDLSNRDAAFFMTGAEPNRTMLKIDLNQDGSVVSTSH